MKHTGGCHCGQVKFETDLESMLVAQCNCNTCRRITGSLNFDVMYAEDEISIKGETNSYVYKGGSGYDNRAFFCKIYHVRIATRNDIMDGMVGVSLGTFDKANSLRTKLEI